MSAQTLPLVLAGSGTAPSWVPAWRLAGEPGRLGIENGVLQRQADEPHEAVLVGFLHQVDLGGGAAASLDLDRLLAEHVETFVRSHGTTGISS